LGDAEALSESTPSTEERAALDALAEFHATGVGYFVEQATRPQTIGYALLDSPVALAAWMIDHDTDSYQKIARAFVNGEPSGNLRCTRSVASQPIRVFAAPILVSYFRPQSGARLRS